jgi:hypothetical protein
LDGRSENCIEVLTYDRGEWTDALDGFSKGSTTLMVADGSRFAPGATAEIQQENDPDIMYTRPDWDQPWSKNAVGQFFRVLSVEGNTLTLDRPLHIDFRADLNPIVRPNGLISESGIEDLYITRLDAGDGHTILIKNAANCWVRWVESDTTYRSHISVSSSMNIEIRGNYLHHSHDYGGGGHGYGVNVGGHTTSALIEDNIFEHLRHSMLIQVGASGNVFGYNYSIDPVENSGFWHPPDISVHGHFPFMNLFEGNIVQEIGIADYWGPAGPGNTYLRNRVETEDIFAQDHSIDQNIIGNELTGGDNGIDIGETVTGTFLHGNNVNGLLQWDPDTPSHVIPKSYYLPAKPSFFGDIQWPSLGGDQPLGQGETPAQRRFMDGTPIPDPGPSTTFADVPEDHPYYSQIEALYQAGYTAGCDSDPLQFCPGRTMNRAESAVFVERGLHGAEVHPPVPESSPFADVRMADWFVEWVTALWEDGYTAGCGADPLTYCPQRGHTRAEGAVFYLRMLHGTDYLPSAPQGIFADVSPQAWYADWVEAAYDALLIEPCQREPQLLFCPEDPLLREVAAFVMVQAKGLLDPTVEIFDIQPRETEGAVSVSWSASDPSGLARVELFRAQDLQGEPDRRSWTLVETREASGTQDSGAFEIYPPIGTSWYSLRAVNLAGEVRREPRSLGPIRIVYSPPSTGAAECEGWQALHPEWLFCDDFDAGEPLVREGRYFEYDDDDGDFIPLEGTGLGGSRAMRALWQPGEVSAGSLKLSFGRNPNAYMRQGLHEEQDFREIYYRMYLKMDPGWSGDPGKLSRATVFTSASDWSQAMIAHLWGDGENHLLIDPARCVDESNRVECQGYNDFAHLDWLGYQPGPTPIFDTDHAGRWYCVEHHVRLNDPGDSNGLQEFWIDDQLEARREGLNFVRAYTDYAINAVFFENYWNEGSSQQQARYFDNIVLSTQPIGCLERVGE